ncbi:hypothetical protein K7W42_20755 [Deinococcus sp. HMF7604]|uniref:hypothetical protein n=1 Tax=Deinococcus betulae TaxID=2873312 RepID=UPI001CC989B7|nr:hypothetical protein [Deinococcus betulae]MBZ9753272.1 hypothetical protein [Deinococcus betulae]
MNRIAALLLALLPSTAFATDLRIYPQFTEVQAPIPARELTFPFAQWRWIQPASFAVIGAAPAAFVLQPAELDWLRTQEGERVTWTSAGQAPVPATLERAEDLLLKLTSGEYVHAQRSELAFSTLPPLQGSVTLRLSGTNAANNASLVYRTQALVWRPRYELNLNGAAASLAALAQISNFSDQVFGAQKVDLFGGSVLQQNQAYPLPVTPGVASEQQMATRTGTTTAAMSVSDTAGAGQINVVGEVRGLQRYALPGGLTIGRGESRTLPFLKPQISGFTRYASVQSYFEPQNRSGQTSRRYKFTSSLSLPTGLVDVRENGLLVGSVQLPAVQAGTLVDLDLGVDPELRYAKTVKRTGQQKDGQGRVISSTYQVTYAFVSTKASTTRVSVREQVYGRSVWVDGQAPQNGQVSFSRQADVPARGKASLRFTLKIMN